MVTRVISDVPLALSRRSRLLIPPEYAGFGTKSAIREAAALTAPDPTAVNEASVYTSSSAPRSISPFRASLKRVSRSSRSRMPWFARPQAWLNASLRHDRPVPRSTWPAKRDHGPALECVLHLGRPFQENHASPTTALPFGVACYSPPPRKRPRNRRFRCRASLVVRGRPDSDLLQHPPLQDRPHGNRLAARVGSTAVGAPSRYRVRRGRHRSLLALRQDRACSAPGRTAAAWPAT